jgi:hypothetical protein
MMSLDVLVAAGVEVDGQPVPRRHSVGLAG